MRVLSLRAQAPSGRRRAMRVVAVCVLAATIAAAALGYRTLRVLTGFVSHTVCSETFVSGFDPDAVYAEALRPMTGIGGLDFALRYVVDRNARTVSTSIAGIATSTAVFHRGAGCLLLRGPPPRITAEAEDPRMNAAAPLPAADLSPAQRRVIDAAIDRAFEETAAPPHRHTKAVVVLRDGQLVAERYAAGVDASTPLLSWSVAKTVVSALIGVLVRDQRLGLDGRAPIPEWAAPDPRSAITVEQLLRMTSGLALDETQSGLDPSSRLLFLSSDMGRDAAAAGTLATPGHRWSYSSGGYLLLSRILRDATGGDAGAVRRFAERELFAPLGMHGVTIESDAHGTPIGSSFVLATARDWARFGTLYASDGVVGARRILPAGWVRTSGTPTLDTEYGAGLWTNVMVGTAPRATTHWSLPGVPAEALCARGLLGQFIVVIPSQRLVVVRFGHAHTPGGDSARVGRLVADVLAALSARS